MLSVYFCELYIFYFIKNTQLLYVIRKINLIMFDVQKLT